MIDKKADIRRTFTDYQEGQHQFVKFCIWMKAAPWEKALKEMNRSSPRSANGF